METKGLKMIIGLDDWTFLKTLQRTNISRFFVMHAYFFEKSFVRMLESKRIAFPSTTSLSLAMRSRSAASTITSCTVDRMFRGAKRSTGARLGQKLIQFIGHTPTATSPCSLFLLPTPAIFHLVNERVRFFDSSRREADPGGDEKKMSAAPFDDRRVSAT